MSSYKPAVMENVGLFVAIAGVSRSGKTKSALRIARGLVGPEGKFAAIDTEGRRMSHYSNEFKFDVLDMQSPFSAERFGELAKEAEAAGYGALVIDSFSLEWSGIGGVLDLYEDFFAKAGFRQQNSDVCWARAKAKHKRMKDDLTQRTIPIIFCLRAKEVPKHLGGGWKVDQDKTFIFDWTVGLTLHPDTPGQPRYDIVDAKGQPLWKVNKEHRAIFPEGQFITEKAGEALQAWRNSGAARAAGSAAIGSAAGQALNDEEDGQDEDRPPQRGSEPTADQDPPAEEPPAELLERATKAIQAINSAKDAASLDKLEGRLRTLIADADEAGWGGGKDALVSAMGERRRALTGGRQDA